MDLRKKLGLSKRKYALKTLISGHLGKFLSKRYLTFWIVSLISLCAFLTLANEADELWFAVIFFYVIFVFAFTVIMLMQNKEIGEISERILHIFEEDYSVGEFDENSLCSQDYEMLNVIALRLSELYAVKSSLENENAMLKSAIESVNVRIEKICSGNFDMCEYDEASIAAASNKMLNTLGQVVAQTIESKTAAERTKVELVTNVSHDLKTPLTSIVSYIDLMSKIEDLPQEAKDYVEIISRKSECLSHTVCDLFDIAKASAMQDIELEEIDGVMLLKQVLADMQDRIEESRTPMRESYSDNACKIISNGKKLYRVFQNLLDNALKYSLSGSRIYVLQHSDDENFTVEINNTANYEMTFDASEIQERFVRGDKSRTDEESNGLGLSIVSTFTKACGGEFEVDIDCDRFIARVSFPKINKI